jgi:hypothetical protein
MMGKLVIISEIPISGVRKTVIIIIDLWCRFLFAFVFKCALSLLLSIADLYSTI